MFLHKAQDVNVLIVGDVMLDRYWTGDVRRISPEAPVPVVHVLRNEERPGGAANVARNVAALGARATLLSVTGSDEPADRLKELLHSAGVKTSLLQDPNLTTTIKLRILTQNQQLLRLDFEQEPPYELLRSKLNEFKALLPQHNVVIFSDYGKGGLLHISEMIDLSRRQGLQVFVDPKGSDWMRYRGANVITPNRTELREVVGSWSSEDDLFRRVQSLRHELDVEVLLLTRSEEGMTLYHDQGMTHDAAMAREVYDVTGAGDTVIATLAVMRGCGMTWEQAMRWSNRAAGIVVGKLGAATVSIEELTTPTHCKQDRPGVLTEDELLLWVSCMRQKAARIVMTNGCFDLLHPGHLDYLEKARSLGDSLVVAVNDDESVRRLKGPARPINPLDVRMRMLSALSFVDCVVPFSEDTPERLICAVKPDVLVKGGDYQPSKIAGAACVEECGGEVIVLDYVPGFSTTGLISEIVSKGRHYG